MEGRTETLSAVLDAGCGVDAPAIQDVTPFMCAALRNHTDCMQLLLEHGADIWKRSKANNSAANYAAQRGNLAALRWLFAADVDLQLLDEGLPTLESYVNCMSFALACGWSFSKKKQGSYKAFVFGFYSVSHVL